MLCRVPSIWHSAKKPLCRVPVLGSRQRLTAVSFRTAADGRLPRAFFAECQTLGKHVFAECGPVPSVLRSVNQLVTESRTLPSAALGKAFFAECPTKGTRQRVRHSAKSRIPVVLVECLLGRCSSYRCIRASRRRASAPPHIEGGGHRVTSSRHPRCRRNKMLACCKLQPATRLHYFVELGDSHAHLFIAMLSSFA
jgi:hypothetical protein